MGLDMYLSGRKDPGFNAEDRTEDGFRVSSIEVELAYWRKHPDLHGFIVKTFAGGVDECQRIDLDEEAIQKIVTAIENDALNHGTTGFFFGRSYQPGEKDEFYSYDEQKADDLKKFDAALKWLRDVDSSNYEWRSIYYQASW